MRNLMRFSPLFIGYVLLVLYTTSPELHGDEARYIEYATNLSNGYFSLSGDVALGNGPGYPIVLLAFVSFDIPWVFAKLLNALFLYLAVLYFYATLRLYFAAPAALWCAIGFGLYTLFLKYLDFIYTETLAVFLICGFLYHFCVLERASRLTWHLFAAAMYLAYLALTKISFGYPLLVGLLVFFLAYVISRSSVSMRAAAVFALALALCSPYLVYTHKLTGKIFYWGSKGGASLYWMTSPFAGELGDWKANTQRQLDAYNEPRLKANHGELFAKQPGLTQVEWDDLLKKRAVENLREHPAEFVQNWVANVGRLVFNYPYSYTPQRPSTFFYLVPNMILATVSLLCLIPTWLGRHRVPRELFVLLFFACLCFAGSTLLSATVRYIVVLVPIFSLWICVTVARTVRIELRR